MPLEKQYLCGKKCPILSSCGAVEARLRIELLDRLPEWLSKKAAVLVSALDRNFPE